MQPKLMAFSGLPGTGKTTLARALAKRLGALYLRIDTIEEAIKHSELKVTGAEDAGYLAACDLAVDNLRIGLDVVTDCVNPIALSRAMFQAAAGKAEAALVNIEVICSDEMEHRRRVEHRHRTDKSEYQPDWEAVIRREYEPWQEDVIRVDTAQEDSQGQLDKLLTRLEALK
ncbi:AAA family ATPase [Aestuariispira insulae]|uniref:Putative kinase n=1 Tax=Aestuariispira insulae TaxID=1461337 RepID=A0A3D9HJS8_9PROT|nr:AAA family ATPase [Aestuariispira insulae]RED49176.1 putative kinase [Aestuariispira insulae]